MALLLLSAALPLPFSAPSAAAPMKVVASIPPVADMVRQVGGDRVEVRLLLPPGASPHTFEPTPSLVREFSGARIFFQVGAGLESWASGLVAAAGKGTAAVTLSAGMSLIREQEEHRGEGGGGTGNPHVWLDPVLAAEMVGRIRDSLAGADPDGSASYRANAAAFGGRLKELDADIAAAVATFRVRSYVAFHPSWDYFAARYGLESAGVIEESPGREPTPRQLAAIISAIRASGIRAVFAEPQLNSRPAEAIAREAGIRVILLDPIGGVPGRETYENLMRWNVGRMAEAMR